MKIHLKFRARHKQSGETEPVLLICFINQYVNVLPERNLEGGNQEEWRFDEIDLEFWSGLKDFNGNAVYLPIVIE